MANITVLSLPHETQKEKDWSGPAFLVFILLVALWAVYLVIDWMRDETQLPISKIAVQGELYYVTADEVRNAVLAAGPLQSFMSQEVDTIHDVISALPWVHRVSVRKQWPDTIRINVTEHVPVAIWNGNKLLDGTGIVFNVDPTSIKSDKLISLHGIDGSETEVLNTWQTLGSMLRQIGLEIAQLSLNERRSWRIITSNGIRIELGRKAKTERLERFVKLFDEIKNSRKVIDYVDLRYDIGAAIGWKTNNYNNKPALTQE